MKTSTVRKGRPMPVARPLARGRRVARGMLAAATALIAGTFSATGAAYAGGGHRPLPEHVFAPYFQTYTSADPAEVSRASGAHYLTMAFLQTAATGSCDILWNGNPATPVSPRTYGPQIARIRAGGGDVVPSF